MPILSMSGSRGVGESGSNWRIQTSLIPTIKLKLPRIGLGSPPKPNPGKYNYPLDHPTTPGKKILHGYNLKLVAGT